MSEGRHLSPPSPGSTHRAAESFQTLGRQARGLSLVVVAIAGLMSLVVGWRRLSGLLRPPQSAQAWISLSLGIVVGAAVVWAAWQSANSPLARRCRQRLLTCYAVAAIVIATAYSGPNVRGTGLALTWLAAVASVALASPSITLTAAIKRPSETTEKPFAAERSQEASPPGSKLTDSGPLEEVTGPGLDDEFALPDEVCQQWTRGVDAEGKIYVSGVVRIPVSKHARVVHCHLPLQPPASPPLEFELEPSEGLEVDWEVGASLPQGVRFDGRIKESPAEDQTVTLAFYGTQAASSLPMHGDAADGRNRSSA